jgi:hypothetical protein
MLVPAILHVSTFDYWFESDAPAISKQLSDRFVLDNERANRHPLFTPVMYPVLFVVRHLARLDTVAALGLAFAGLAALWAALFFLVLRRVGLRRVEALTFTALALAGSCAIFWFPVPETFAPAALTLLVPLAALVWHEQTGRLSWIGCVLIGALTLSMTVTNAVAGFLVCLVVLGWKRGFTAIGSSLALVAAGQFVARLVFPHTAYFFLPAARESAYLLSPLAGSLGDRLAGFFLHGLIIPPIQQGYAGYLSVQQAFVSVPGPVLLGWGLWLVLLAAGIFGLRTSGRRKLSIVLLGLLVSQLALVLVFGQETFVYALQSGPLLVALAAFGCLTPFRRWVLGGAAVLAVLAAVENGRRFTEAAGLLRHRFDGARAYAQALNDRTAADDLIVLGLPPAAAEGLIARPVRAVRDPGRLSRIPRFDSLRVVRKGWQLHYEHWSRETLEQMHRAGARYFASEYAYGIRNDTAVRSYLDAHGRLLESTPDWVIFALRDPP